MSILYSLWCEISAYPLAGTVILVQVHQSPIAETNTSEGSARFHNNSQEMGETLAQGEREETMHYFSYVCFTLQRKKENKVPTQVNMPNVYSSFIACAFCTASNKSLGIRLQNVCV